MANRLAQETSPYLLEHAQNPVDWYPWGPEALARARQENKPILLSIGYSACHWCHVMARESFEDEETGAAAGGREARTRTPRRGLSPAGARVRPRPWRFRRRPEISSTDAARVSAAQPCPDWRTGGAGNGDRHAARDGRRRPIRPAGQRLSPLH